MTEWTLNANNEDRVWVGIRVRPPIEAEFEVSKQISWQWTQQQIFTNKINWDDMTPEEAATIPDDRHSLFSFDRVFNPFENNSIVYEEQGLDLVQRVIEGFNSTIIAYGQTTSGKTHTILGTERDPGILQLAVKDLFRFMESNKATHLFRATISYCEIYQETIQDLIDSANHHLNIVDDPLWGPSVKNLSYHEAKTPEEVFRLLKRGMDSRHLGKTDMNDASSRSHTIFQVRIESKPRLRFPSVNKSTETQLPHEDEIATQTELFEYADSSIANNANDVIEKWENDVFKQMAVSSLNIVDLAGSERVSKTKAKGLRLKEAGYINKSLSALGNVIAAINAGVAHKRFRDSKLTRLLKSALGGNSYTAMICCLSPVLLHHDESRSTLQFAQRASAVVTHARLNQIESGDSILNKFKEQVMLLQQQLALNVNEKNQLQEKVEALEGKLATSFAQAFKTPKLVRQPRKRPEIVPSSTFRYATPAPTSKVENTPRVPSPPSVETLSPVTQNTLTPDPIPSCTPPKVDESPPRLMVVTAKKMRSVQQSLVDIHRKLEQYVQSQPVPRDYSHAGVSRIFRMRCHLLRHLRGLFVTTKDPLPKPVHALRHESRDDLIDEIRIYETRLRVKEEVIAQLKSSIQDLEREISGMRQVARAADIDRDSELWHSKTQCTQLESQISSLKTQLSQAREESQSRQKSTDSLKGEIVVCINQITAAEENAQRYKAKIETLQHELTENEKIIQNLRGRVSDFELEKAKFLMVAEYKTECEAMMKRVHEERQAIASERLDLQKEKKKFEATEKSWKAAHESLTLLRHHESSTSSIPTDDASRLVDDAGVPDSVSEFTRVIDELSKQNKSLISNEQHAAHKLEEQKEIYLSIVQDHNTLKLEYEKLQQSLELQKEAHSNLNKQMIREREIHFQKFQDGLKKEETLKNEILRLEHDVSIASMNEQDVFQEKLHTATVKNIELQVSLESANHTVEALNRKITEFQGRLKSQAMSTQQRDRRSQKLVQFVSELSSRVHTTMSEMVESIDAHEFKLQNLETVIESRRMRVTEAENAGRARPLAQTRVRELSRVLATVQEKAKGYEAAIASLQEENMFLRKQLESTHAEAQHDMVQTPNPTQRVRPLMVYETPQTTGRRQERDNIDTPFSTSSTPMMLVFQELHQTTRRQNEILREENRKLLETVKKKDQEATLAVGLLRETENDFKILLEVSEKQQNENNACSDKIVRVKQRMQQLLKFCRNTRQLELDQADLSFLIPKTLESL